MNTSWRLLLISGKKGDKREENEEEAEEEEQQPEERKLTIFSECKAVLSDKASSLFLAAAPIRNNVL